LLKYKKRNRKINLQAGKRRGKKGAGNPRKGRAGKSRKWRILSIIGSPSEEKFNFKI